MLDPTAANTNFWTTADRLVATSKASIDRPQHSHHPRRHEVVYPLNYGHLEDTQAVDGQWVDVWLGSQDLDETVACVAMVDPPSS